MMCLLDAQELTGMFVGDVLDVVEAVGLDVCRPPRPPTGSPYPRASHDDFQLEPGRQQSQASIHHLSTME